MEFPRWKLPGEFPWWNFLGGISLVEFPGWKLLEGIS